MPSVPRHYELSDWVDYIRKVGNPDRLAAMEKHLVVEQCERCARLAQMLEAAYGTARGLADVEVPETTVQRAREIFKRVPDQSWKDLAVRVGEWVEDLVIPGGGPGWAPAGVRSAGARRQLLYRAGSLQARLEAHQSPEGSQVVTGVISDLSDPGARWTGTRVLLVEGARTLAETTATEFGEFDLTAVVSNGFRLVVVLDKAGQVLDVALDRSV